MMRRCPPRSTTTSFAPFSRRSLRACPIAGDVEPLTATQRGAIGHVVGIRGPTGRRFVVKMFPAAVVDRAAVEAAALRIAGGLPGVPVPVVQESGSLDAAEPVAYLVMSRLPGVRWAELRSTLSPVAAAQVAESAGSVLRRCHRSTGRWYGHLLEGAGGSPSWSSAIADRWAASRDGYLASGGAASTATTVDEWVRGQLARLVDPPAPVLCHNDYNGGNLMVCSRRAPAICGVFDWERACWDDPMCDLARIHNQLSSSDATLLPALLTGYGRLDSPARDRLTLHKTLHLVQERAWIAVDRPRGWQGSLSDLDQVLSTLPVP